MSIINEYEEKGKAFDDRIEMFYKRFGIRHILRKINVVKFAGVGTCLIVLFVIKLVFSQKNLYRVFASERHDNNFEKDTVYRLLNNSSARWEELVPLVSSEVIPVIADLTGEERRCALIVDDTPYYRNRSKKVELLSRFKDHSKNRYYKGFTMLNLGWSDGVSFVPVDFRMVASNNDDNLLEGSHVKEDNRTIATKRRKQARTPKPELVLKMLKNVKGTPAQTKHVLFDSWFSPPKALLDVKQLGYDVVARLKDHENYRYLYNGEVLSIRQILKANKRRRGKSRYILSVDAEIRHNGYSETVKAKIVYVRSKNNSKDWLALISTDTALTEEEIIALYGKRWDIEPYHKVLKSTLKLEKEFQTRSFDAIVAHAAMVVVRYIFLALESRENVDERSIGDLFWFTCDELEDISFSVAFELLISIFKNFFYEHSTLTSAQIDESISLFFASLPSYIKLRLRFVGCES